MRFGNLAVERRLMLAESIAASGAIVHVLVPAMFAKADQGSLGKVYADGEGAYRWITVHPHGDSEPGVPIKIREDKNQKGVWHVVAGAGGKLNYLKLTDVKSAEHYKQQSKEKAEKKKEGEKATREMKTAQREQMSPEEREAAASRDRARKATLEEAQTLHEARRREFVANVAGALGWKDDEWKFDATAARLKAAGASEKRIASLEQQHLKRVEQRATAALSETKRKLVADAESRRAVGLGEVPLESDDPDKVALSDLEQEHVKGGKGFKPITRSSSDEEIAAQLARANKAEVDTELRQAYDRLADSGDQADRERVVELEAEKRSAELVEKAATMKPEEIEQGLAAADADRAALIEGFKSYVPRLRELEDGRGKEGTVSVEEEALQIRLAEDRAKLDDIGTRKDELSIVAGEMGGALKGERKSLSSKRARERYEEIRAEKGEQAAEDYKAARAKFIQKGHEYQQEIQFYRETGALSRPNLEAKAIDDPRKAIELIAAEKALRANARKLSAAEKSDEDLDEQVFGRNMFTGLGPQPSREAIEKAEKDVGAEVMAKRNGAFLDRVESPDLLLGRGGRFTENYDKKTLYQALDRHLSAGAFNSINNASLAYAKDSLIPREVVDTLGARGAAELLAWRMRQSEDPATLREMATKLGDYHAKASAEELDETMRGIEEDLDRADEVLKGASSPSELEVLLEARTKRQAALEDAREKAGQTLGEFEATAALVDALGKKPSSISVNLGETGSETAIRQLRAIGLERDDYSIDTDGKNYVATIHETGFPRLIGKPDAGKMKLHDEAVAIKKGERDEPDWKPKGTIVRAATTFDADGLEPPSLTTSLRPFQKFGDGGNVDEHVREHVARRAANGEPLDSVLLDMNSNIMSVPEGGRQQFRESLDKIFPTRMPLVENGKPVLNEDGTPRTRLAKASDHGPRVEQVVTQYFRDQGLDQKAPINAQSIRHNTKETQEAITRALAPDPRRMVAFTRLGDLGDQDKRALRSYFQSTLGAEGGAKKGGSDSGDQLKKHLADEPTKETKSLFGGSEKTPEWLDWERKRKDLAGTAGAHTGAQGPTWNQYIAAMGGLEKAYTALQDRLKSDFVKDFHQGYTTLHDEPLRIGIRPIAHSELHLGFVDPAKREKMLAERRRILDDARQRVSGKYAGGSALERMERLQQSEEIERQNQMGLLGASSTAPQRRKPDPHERYTLGNRAEAEIASVLPKVASNWRPGDPVNLLKDKRWADPRGANARFIHQQRTIKMFLKSKRMAAGLGTGSGKTSIGIGALSHLIHTPDSGVKRGLFLVPASVQGQFRGGFADTIEPGSMNYAADPGLSRESRMAQHRDKSLNAVVQTHQGFRDDMVHLLAEHWGTSPAEASKKFMEAMPGKTEQDRRSARSALMKEVLAKNGVDYQHMMVDEGHQLLDRDGKPDSVLSKVAQAVSDNVPYYMSASADLAKNDVSELRSLLDKISPDGRYSDAEDWKRRYGVNTTAAAEALKREIAPYVYSAEIPGTHQVNSRTIKNGNPLQVDLHPEQAKQYSQVKNAVRQLRAARIGGRVDVAAAKVLYPERFAAAPTEAHEAIAREIQRNPNAEHAYNRIVNLAPRHQNAKIQAIVHELKDTNTREKPVVIFAHNLAAVDELSEALAEAGHRVEKMTGADSSKERDRKRLRFQPEVGDAKSDVFVVSDAAEAGLNLQRGQKLIQYDRPQTAKTHAQRSGRIDRLGQKAKSVDLVDVASNTDFEARAADRVNRKYALRGILSDPAEMIDDTGVARVFSEARRAAAERGKAAA